MTWGAEGWRESDINLVCAGIHRIALGNPEHAT